MGRSGSRSVGRREEGERDGKSSENSSFVQLLVKCKV